VLKLIEDEGTGEGGGWRGGKFRYVFRHLRGGPDGLICGIGSRVGRPVGFLGGGYVG